MERQEFPWWPVGVRWKGDEAQGKRRLVGALAVRLEKARGSGLALQHRVVSMSGDQLID